ncbi:Protein kinase-like domain superfamily protein [Abortiporus biennis]
MDNYSSSKKTDHINHIFDPDSFETVEESPAAYITRGVLLNPTFGIPGTVLAIKSSSYLPEYSQEPHDIVKELEILSQLNNINVIEVLGHTYDRGLHSLNFWMPLIPRKFRSLLDSPTFSPHPLIDLPGSSNTENERKFCIVAKSIIFQTISAIAYLHDPSNSIAHRDIKPRNLLLDENGTLKLIDFGVAWKEDIVPSSKHIWPEPRGKMYVDVCTGPYRAPELIFGPTDYDPFAVDLWSLGTTLSELFTPLRLESDEEIDDEAEEDQTTPPRPFIVPSNIRMYNLSRTQWSRDSLFDSSRGAIGLAWSIFKIRGTPTPENWPTFSTLPDADKLSFQIVPTANLRTFLPNLPSEHPSDSDSFHYPPEQTTCSLFDLLRRFLVYSPEKRLKAADALNHKWLINDKHPLLLPEGYSTSSALDTIHEWQGCSLGDLMLSFLR